MTSPLMNVYARAPLAFVKGEGAWLYGSEGGEPYLDCVAGVASNALGHCHPALVAALTEQGNKLWHVSNMFEVPGQDALAARLTTASFADTVFFANTGTEAVECAIKVARRYHAVRGDAQRQTIIGFHGAFHGRTYGALNAAGNAAHLDGFGAPMPGFVHRSPDDWAALAAAIGDPTTAAVLIEPVQGEGGARAMTQNFLESLRAACTAAGVLLIYDEVQSGMGRTGQLFAHQWFPGAEPDIMAVAKALGSGLPVAACLATAEAASGMAPGGHGSTFGGNPLAMAVAIAAFDEIAKPETLEHARALSQHLRGSLAVLAARWPDVITDVRGKGLLIALKLVPNNRAFIAAARDQRLLVAGGGDNIVRLLPPLTMSLVEADEVVARLDATCAAMMAAVEVAA
ncbi:acetylornithine/N-succinyldiaminopimelate aminotransferase [Sphingopyxis sp. OAS728]|uniref:aspartate aminotransferase family protein n=1 Tax=Sphingopyxis sp. OAS728 TaxID=2663823 RepID=UPI001A08AFE6|nr:aspartate aminotransferase family protein [Sphingopyxis sp. OAS728]MBE1529969.1 acetylornithine/N-succinyldiaminopimelate aminotransferase [Sphingopyxis sp. OAS728]